MQTKDPWRINLWNMHIPSFLFFMRKQKIKIKNYILCTYPFPKAYWVQNVLNNTIMPSCALWQDIQKIMNLKGIEERIKMSFLILVAPHS